MTSQSAERIGGWLLAPLALVAGGAAERLVIAAVFCQCADVAADLYPTARHERGPYGAVGRLAAVCPRHVVLHALADYRLFQAALGGAETLYYLAAHHPAAGDKGFCLLAGLGCACPASAAVSAAGRCAAGALFSPFAAGKTDFC